MYEVYVPEAFVGLHQLTLSLFLHIFTSLFTLILVINRNYTLTEWKRHGP